MTAMGWAFTKKELANIAGYTYQRLYVIDRDMPEDKKLFVPTGKEGKKYDLSLFVQRWAEYNRERGEDDDADLTKVKTQHEKVKKQKTELEVARMKGEFVDVEEVYRAWADVAATVRNRFVTMAAKLAPALVSIDSADRIEEIIDRDVRDALKLIASAPMPTGETEPERAEHEAE